MISIPSTAHSLAQGLSVPVAKAAASRSGSQGQGSGREQVSQALSADERRELQRLQSRDREVRAHEQAHLSAAGHLVRGGGASFQYQRGPDGVAYAVGGEVSIDTSPVPGDPQATLQKAEQVRRAALAPADPSTQDRTIAARALRMAAEARTEILRQGEQQASLAYQAVQNSGPGSSAIIDLIA
jgi:hypothetical protein